MHESVDAGFSPSVVVGIGAGRHALAVAIGVAWGVELSQLYHAPWIDAIRTTIPGRLVLGTTFNWPDLPAYAVGIALGSLVESRRRG